jgi:hypothetical protein
MYPATFFGLFPVFPRNHRAFVAMSFDHRFDARWSNVLRPGLESVGEKSQPLEPHRIDLTMSGDSVLTGILDEIGRCRVVIADISSLGVLDGRPVRNENVFYEVALAHAVRLPEEVVMFRSDTHGLAFDISNVRVHQYDPDGNADAARKIVTDTVVGSLNELSARRHLAVRRAAEGLDADSLAVLADACSPEGVRPPDRRTMGQVITSGVRLDAISRLLELTAIRTEYSQITHEVLMNPARLDDQVVRYRATPFGLALSEHVLGEMGFDDPQIRWKIAKMKLETNPVGGDKRATEGPTT